MERSFARSMDSLPAVFAFVDQVTGRDALEQTVSFPVTMAIEELFTNMVKYNPSGKGNITIRMEIAGDAVRVHLIDPDSEPFDITVDRQVDVAARLKDRKPGGLGIHLVQRMMDRVEYTHHNRRSEIRLTKNR